MFDAKVNTSHDKSSALKIPAVTMESSSQDFLLYRLLHGAELEAFKDKAFQVLPIIVESNPVRVSQEIEFLELRDEALKCG